VSSLAVGSLSREGGAFVVHEMDNLKIAQHFSAGLLAKNNVEPAKRATDILIDQFLPSTSRT
jgi:hypothetical protein